MAQAFPIANAILNAVVPYAANQAAGAVQRRIERYIDGSDRKHSSPMQRYIPSGTRRRSLRRKRGRPTGRARNFKRRKTLFKARPVRRQFRSARNSRTGRVYSRRRTSYRKRFLSQRVAKGVKALIKTIGDNDKSVNTVRKIDSGQLTVAVNSCSYTEHTFLSQANIEGYTAFAKVGDTKDDGTLQAATVDLNSLNSTKTKILSYIRVYKIRNNGQIPVNLETFHYFFKKRQAATGNVLADFKQGLSDKGVDVSADAHLTDHRYNLYDSPLVKTHFKMYKHRKYRLNAGDEVNIMVKRAKPFMYDPDEFDHHSASYFNPRYSQSVVFRMSGIVTHDSVNNTNVGTGAGTLDYIYTQQLKYIATSAPRISFLTTGSGALDAQANNAVADGPAVNEMHVDL